MVSYMKYIEKVILENFQSHKYTVLDFTKGLNSIVGPTDSGKTAIFIIFQNYLCLQMN